MSGDIDVVVTWLDSNCTRWQESFSHYKKMSSSGDISVPRFRDWNNFRCWFRGLEKNMPWVRRVHLVTNGLYPDWINTNNPKLNLVSHKDYIPEEYLPTFNSRVIEINLHRLEGLSEKFVLFNDDFFLLNKVEPSDFFVSDLPRDCAIMTAHSGEGISNVLMNNLSLINNTFQKKEVILSNLFSWFNLGNGIGNMRNLCLLPWPRFTGFYEPHLPQAYLKKTLKDCWELYPSDMKRTCLSRFRQASDINHFLFRYLQLVTNSFAPSKVDWLGRFFQCSDENARIVAEAITKSSYKVIAINDGEMKDFDRVRNVVNTALFDKFRVKSDYEQ